VTNLDCSVADVEDKTEMIKRANEEMQKSIKEIEQENEAKDGAVKFDVIK